MGPPLPADRACAQGTVDPRSKGRYLVHPDVITKTGMTTDKKVIENDLPENQLRIDRKIGFRCCLFSLWVG